jgi:serine/threonine protein kinase
VAGEKVLGKGNFGFVLLGKLKVDGGKGEVEVVVKRTHAANSEPARGADIYREAVMMLENQHPHLVLCYGLAMDTLPYQIVVEKCGKGSLEDYLKKEKGKLSEAQKLSWCAQAADGCAFLEANCVLHRDIAARNALLRGRLCHLKISDLGMAQKANRLGQYQGDVKKNVVPVRWAAPEVLDQALFSYKSDAFALGVLCWEVFHDGAKPWGSIGAAKVVELLRQGRRLTFAAESVAPSQIVALAAVAFLQEPAQRPTLASICQQLAPFNKSLPSTISHGDDDE